MPTRFPKQIGLSEIPSAGPYYVAASSPEGIVLRRNPNYPGSRPHHFDEIDVVPGDVKKVEAGQADVAYPVPPDVATLDKRFGAQSRAARQGRQRLFFYPTSSMLLVALNTSRPLFRDASLRKALNYAVNRRGWAGDGLGTTFKTPIDHYLPVGFPGGTNIHPYPLSGDPKRARRLAAGRGGRAVFYYLGDAPIFLEARIEKALRAIGVGVVPRPFASSVEIANAERRGEKFDVAVTPWYPYYPDPASALNALMNGRVIRAQDNTNTAYFDDPVFNAKLDAASKLTGAARLTAYSRLDEEISREAAPYIPMSTFNVPVFYSARIGCQVWSSVPHYELDVAALCLKK
jgi:peptide/nickel transport system substrate-binding protein